ncbi:MAG: polysaccharide biosynthesis protein [Clostridia bacterium]|nr:polysaccharide biosynthesis protein [Clostridia bacterium]
MKRSKAMFYNLLIVTATTVFMRFVAVAFNVYVTNKLGAYGVGVYSLITSVGAFAVTLATSGVNLAATRLTAAAIGKGSEAEVRSAMRKCIVYSVCFGAAASALLLLLSGPVSVHILNDVDCILPLRIMSASLPFISLSSAMYGYFTAERRVIKSSAAQIFEQFVKIGAIVALISVIAPKETKYACVAVIAGGTLSEIASFVFSFIMYKLDLAKHVGKKGKVEPGLTRELLGTALPIAFTTYVRSGLVTVEHLLIPRGLRRSGRSPEVALASYGVLHGMVFPVILFPMTVMSAFAGLLVPELSECQARGETERIDRIVSRVLQAALAFSCGVAGIMLCFSGLLGEAIYHNSEAGAMIRILAPLIPVMYVDHIVDGMLKGLGEQIYSMKVNIADATLSVILVYFFVPVWGIYGYVGIVIAMEIINASLSIARLLSLSSVKIRLAKWLIKPLVCVFCATSLSGFAVSALTGIGEGLAALLAVCGSSVLYFIFLRLTGGISADDISWFKRAIK